MVIILLILILYLLNDRSSEDFNSQHLSDSQANIEVDPVSKIKSKEKTDIQHRQQPLQKPRADQNNTRSYSYMDLYKKNILAHDCKFFFKSEIDFDKNTDPYALLSRNISFRSNGRQQQVSKVQVLAMTDLLSQCRILETEVQALIDKNQYKQKHSWSHPIVSYSLKRLYEAKPETEEEHAIVDVQWKLGKFQKVFMSYGSYVNGKSSLSRSERNQVEDEIKELRELMYPKNFPASSYANEDFLKQKEKRDKLQNEIDRKNQYLKDAMFIDKKQLQRYRDQFAYLYPHVVQLLKTKFAYVFIDVMQELSIGSTIHGKKGNVKNMKFILKFYPKYKTLNELIYAGVGFKDHAYSDQIITPAINLYLCYLGLDCNAQSRTIRNYCLGLNNYPLYQEACNTDLKTFYYQTYLSTNQKVDVDKIIDFMVSEYAL